MDSILVRVGMPVNRLCWCEEVFRTNRRSRGPLRADYRPVMLRRSCLPEEILERFKAVLNSKYFLWLILAIPLAWLGNAWLTDKIVYGELIHATGDLSGRLLILTMAITPFRMMFPNAQWPTWLLHRRRFFGVAAFGYALVHTIIYVDRKQSLALILKEGAEFSMWTGWAGLAIFTALAITSNDASVRRLRRAWKKLHRWVYPAAILVFAHWIFVAFSYIPGLIHLLVLVFLETYRIWKHFKSMSHAH